MRGDLATRGLGFSHFRPRVDENGVDVLNVSFAQVESGALI